MRIEKIKLENFRIYRDVNEIDLRSNSSKNISLIAGKNGYGKTTFLTSLIWCFYGKLMSQVEDKYKLDIRNSGGYDQYLKSLINRDIKLENKSSYMSVEIQLGDLLIPSVPCQTVSIRRTLNLETLKESIKILIDGDENELTKSVGYEVFINDFILPREIAKFFFFDAEKIVSLAEAKSKEELKSLSKAYSEVLGIKKYEELKGNLESLLKKLNRNGVSKVQKEKLEEYLKEELNLEKQISHNSEKQVEIDSYLSILQRKCDSLQEKLIREGNSITLEELKELKSKRDELKVEAKSIKGDLKKLFDLIPFVLSGHHFNRLKEQLDKESKFNSLNTNNLSIEKELKSFSDNIFKSISSSSLSQKIKTDIQKRISSELNKKLNTNGPDVNTGNILLEFSEQRAREFQAIYDNIKTSFLIQFNEIVKSEKINRALLSRTLNKIKQAEARKNNHLAKQFRTEKNQADTEIQNLVESKNQLIEEQGILKHKHANQKKVRVEYEKEFNLIETDKKKFSVTLKLLEKINVFVNKIKKEKKYSLQKSISLGLKKLMHKKDFISHVRVNIMDDVMDIDLLDTNDNIISKDTLSKGEQQLYATALLKALVDESGIKFPVFIDSPLQKFDKFHSKNIIQEFYPTVSDQVVLFPLLEKELSESEFDLLKPNLNKAFLITNVDGSSNLKGVKGDKLFNEFKKDKDVYSH